MRMSRAGAAAAVVSAVKLEKSTAKAHTANMSTAWHTASSVNLRDLIILGGPGTKVVSVATHAERDLRFVPPFHIISTSQHSRHTSAQHQSLATRGRVRTRAGQASMAVLVVISYYDFEESKPLGALALPPARAAKCSGDSITGVSGQRYSGGTLLRGAISLLRGHVAWARAFRALVQGDCTAIFLHCTVATLPETR